MATRQQARTTQVLFPMVDLDLKVALEWLKGMWTLPQSGPQLKVTRALRQTKVKMNEEGVRIEEAAAVGIAFAAVFLPNRHVIDRPFLMWVDRPGLESAAFRRLHDRRGLEESGKKLGIGSTKTMCVLLTVMKEVIQEPFQTYA